MKNRKATPRPELSQLKAELAREQHKRKFKNVLRSTIFTLVVVAAAAVLVATLWMPVLQVYGRSMEPFLSEGDIVVSIKSDRLEQGDLVAFYFNNKILVKRVICGSGHWVNIDENGTVFIDGEPLYEPYLTDKALGQCDLELPYQVPDERYFVMGDNRTTSVDSRTSVVGCIAAEQIVGKIVFRVWPFDRFGQLN